MAFVIDTLDECETTEVEVLSALAGLQNPQKVSIPIFMTSRRHTTFDLESLFRQTGVAVVKELLPASQISTNMQDQKWKVFRDFGGSVMS